MGLDAIQQGFVSNRYVRTIYNPVNRERIARMAGEPLPQACQFWQEDAEYGILMPEFEETSDDRPVTQPYDVWSETMIRMVSDDELRGW